MTGKIDDHQKNYFFLHCVGEKNWGSRKKRREKGGIWRVIGGKKKKKKRELEKRASIRKTNQERIVELDRFADETNGWIIHI